MISRILLKLDKRNVSFIKKTKNIMILIAILFHMTSLVLGYNSLQLILEQREVARIDVNFVIIL